MTDTPGHEDESDTTPGSQPPPYGSPPPGGQPPPYGSPPPGGQPPPYGSPPPGGQPPAYGYPPPPVYGQPPAPGYGQPSPSYGQPAANSWGMTGDASAPFGRDPMSGLPFSDKSKTVAGLLQLLLPCVGVCGVGRLMTGHLTIGLIQLIGYWVGFVLTVLGVGLIIVPAIWIWSVVDGILMLTGSVKDSKGFPLRP